MMLKLTTHSSNQIFLFHLSYTLFVILQYLFDLQHIFQQ